MAPSPAGSTGSISTFRLDIRLAGGIYALNRFLMTLQNKRVPATGIKIDGDIVASHITLVLDCPEETARRYTALFSSLEDVEEVGPPVEDEPETEDPADPSPNR